MSEIIDSYNRDAPIPEMGSEWVWERDNLCAQEAIVVIGTRWNGEEWWILTQGSCGTYWNDLSRFWEAVNK